jgi:hypothetical protein
MFVCSQMQLVLVYIFLKRIAGLLSPYFDKVKGLDNDN